MPDVFITLEEAAAFEGITYEAMKKRVQRSPEQHNVKSQAREGGGKDQVLISTSSLSAKARKMCIRDRRKQRLYYSPGRLCPL